MAIKLSLAHYIYILFMLLVLVFMIRKRDTSIICIIGILTLGIVSTNSIYLSVIGIFNSFIYAITELLGTILIISIVSMLSSVLSKTGIDELMVSPFVKFIKTPTQSYWVIGIIIMIVSLFFWPAPAFALVGAILLPVAIKTGLPPIGIAMSMSLFGHGIALSGDYIIQAAPKLAADAAGIPVGDVISSSIPLVITMGIISTIAGYFMLKRGMKNGKIKVPQSYNKTKDENKINLLSYNTRKKLAVGILLIFIVDIIIMFKANLQGGIATALIGGTAVVISIILSLIYHKNDGIEELTNYYIEGLLFGFKIFGVIIPIAAFFYLGDLGFVEIFGEVLPKGSQGLVNDISMSIANAVPLNEYIGSAIVTTVGSITGLDGSGFSGIALTGSVAKLFGAAIGKGVSTLAALGQIAAIWEEVVL